MIPKIIHRTIPLKTNAVIDFCWDSTLKLHPDWEFMTHYDKDEHPLVKKYLKKCPSGAFRADLIRLEQVYIHGGIFLDSDVQIIRPLDDFLKYECFNALEHNYYAGNIVFGATPEHPAIKATLDFAIEHLDMLPEHQTVSDNYYSGVAWGPWVHTEVMVKARKDVKHLHKLAFNPFNLIDKLSPELEALFPLWNPVRVNDPKIIKELDERTYGAHLYNWSWVEGRSWDVR